MRLSNASRIAAVFVTAAAIGLYATPAAAQARQGFTFSVGLGAGSAGISCDGCDDIDRESTVSGYLRFGGTPQRNAVVGGELHGWGKEIDDIDASLGFISGFVQWYPVNNSGLFLKGNLGFGSTRFAAEEGGVQVELESTGFAIGGGLGFDVRMSRIFSLSPFVNYMSTVGAEAKLEGNELGSTLDGSLLQFGIGFTWH